MNAVANSKTYGAARSDPDCDAWSGFVGTERCRQLGDHRIGQLHAGPPVKRSPAARTRSPARPATSVAPNYSFTDRFDGRLHDRQEGRCRSIAGRQRARPTAPTDPSPDCDAAAASSEPTMPATSGITSIGQPAGPPAEVRRAAARTRSPARPGHPSWLPNYSFTTGSTPPRSPIAKKAASSVNAVADSKTYGAADPRPDCDPEQRLRRSRRRTATRDHRTASCTPDRRRDRSPAARTRSPARPAPFSLRTTAIATGSTAAFTIAKANPDCSSIAGYEVTYDGSPHTASGECLGVGADAARRAWTCPAPPTPMPAATAKLDVHRFDRQLQRHQRHRQRYDRQGQRRDLGHALQRHV